jgi:hypothetical protein
MGSLDQRTIAIPPRFQIINPAPCEGICVMELASYKAPILIPLPFEMEQASVYRDFLIAPYHSRSGAITPDASLVVHGNLCSGHSKIRR